ncbi:MAG: glycosyltransferase [Lachnospiraceae bacterium]|nr:glycosyltransferase [Lachnospiraceae bacterium]
MQDLISVIVPIYKVEKYLNKCVDGIINQTYTNLEIILVDDGTPDNCGAICDEYAEKDSRIKVIHKSNGGLSDARNVAIDIMQGKYVTFIDSDDYIGTEYIQCMYEALKNTDSDLAICEYAYVREDGTMINRPCNNKKVQVFNQERALYELLNMKKYSNSAWGKLYKSEHFSDVRYPKGRLYEDVPTTYKLFMKSAKIAFCANVQYYYLFREAAISKQKFTPARMDGVIFAEEMVKEVTNKYPSLKKIGECRLFDAYYSVHILLAGVVSDNQSISQEIYMKIKELCRRVFLYHESGIKRKMQIVAFVLNK